MAGRMGEPARTRQPARTSSRIGSRSTPAGLGGSSRWIVARSTADTRNDAASKAIAMGAVMIWTRNPLTPNPLNSATDSLADRALFAVMRRALTMTVGRYATLAVLKN